MAVQTQFRRGNTLSHSTFTGVIGEVTVDTDKNVAVVHNGSTAGGFPLVKAQDLTTANVTEVSNQYFTNARARAAISVTGAGTYDNTTGVITVTGGVTSVGGATGAVSNVQLANAIITSGLLTTANVSEVTNLYYTNVRVYANISPLIASSFNQANTAFDQANISFAQANVAFNSANVRLLTKANIADLTTANVTEGSNLYFTNARVTTALSTQTLTNATFSGNVTASYFIGDFAGNIAGNGSAIVGINTSIVTEGSNLYYTNARVYANVVTLGYATTSYVTNALANLVASAPATLDTLNELAVALGNDNNFSTSILTIVGNKANASVVTASFNQANTAFAQANIAFAQANVAFAQANLKFSSSGGNITGDTSITGNFSPSTDIVYNLGSASKRWKDLFLSGNTINLGSATLSSSGTAIQLPASSSVGGQAISSFSGVYNDLTNKPANVISFSNVSVNYYDTINLLSISKNIYRSGEVRYNIMDDNSDSYSTVVHNFLHRDNVIVYSNTIVSLGTEIHTSHMTIAGENIVLFLVSSNLYARNYFLESNNYQSNVSANVKGYVTLIEV